MGESSGSGEGDLDDYSNTSQRGIVAGYVQSPIVLLFIIIGIPWNALVIGTILKRKLFTRPSVMLLLNLATVNFLTCLLVMPFPVVLGILARSFKMEDFPVYNKVCQSWILFILFQLVSIETVAVLSVDRVIYLKKPLTYEHIVTPRRMLLVILITWAASTSISLVPIWRVEQVGYLEQFATCNIIIREDQVANYFIFLVAVGSTLVHIAGNVSIIYITRKYLMAKVLRLMQVRSRTRDDGGLTESVILRNHNRSQLQLVKLCVATFSVSLITELPVIVLFIALPITDLTPSLYPIVPIGYILLLSKSLLHPIMEASMTHEIRDIISQFCKSSFTHIRRWCNSCT